MSFDESDLGALDAPQIHAGKVRRLYEWPSDDSGRARMVMVATDAVSAYDHVLSRPIPDKGAVLTQLSQWWFGQLGAVVDNHVLSTEVPDVVAGRAVICEALRMFPVECVARGYLTGSGWAEYQVSGTVCGVALPEGLHDGSRLPEPIFTPATKADLGEHDENIDFERMTTIVGAEVAERLRDLTLAIYSTAEGIARERGIVLADTKVEFGQRPDGTIVLADEVLTPDSSRFWDAEAWQQGRLESFDKQYLRDWLTGESGWDKAADEPPPPLPDDVVAATRERYLEAYRRLTGSEFVAAGSGDATSSDLGRITPMAKIVVNVMPKPEILDPQGKAVTGALQRIGHPGLTVRQGKRFEIEVEGEITQARLDEVRQAAETLLANTVIEQFDVIVEDADGGVA